MYYKLSNGDQVNFQSNLEAAKFIYLVMPFKKLTFLGVKPHVTMTDEVRVLMKVYNKILTKIQKSEEVRINEVASLLDDFEDKAMPF